MDTTLYCEWLLAQGLSSATVNIYRGKLLQAYRVVSGQGWDMRHLTASQLGTLADAFPNSHPSRALLRTALAHYWQMCGVDNPVGAIAIPDKPPARYRGLDDHDADRLEARATGVWPGGTAVMLGLYLALRRTEMASLRWDSFDGDLTEARIMGKGRRTRFLPVHPVLRGELASRICDGYVFPGRADRAFVHSATIRRWIGDLACDIGLTITNPHSLRYTCANRLYEETDDIYLVQRFLGHSDPATTARYLTKADDERMRAAVHRISYHRARGEQAA